ncbi:HAD family hydrolase [Bacillus sp. FJAT-42376]|uniref:HAD family hydrolase n=1 Tax=Bacillus sp. FJAT-42376 TaxID=2014076 RepID=UPI000F4FD8E0|nr:HAD family hydrolase [Bacillus sp. FJAT-42376]AZB41696.1 HAD family hydrolase [Bacillus sp. FJAT-42376]
MKAIIFDFDGTLANTLPICFEAFQDVFRKYDQRDVTSEDIVAMFGPSEPDIIRKNLLHENKEEAIEHFYFVYKENHHQLVKPNEEISDLLQMVKDRGMKLAIVTGKARRSLDLSLEELKMNVSFDVIITGDDVEKPKPDPEGILKVLSQLGIDHTEAMFIGDSDADIGAGLGAGVLTVGVQWLPEFQTAEFSRKPDAMYTSIGEFKKTLIAMEVR